MDDTKSHQNRMQGGAGKARHNSTPRRQSRLSRPAGHDRARPRLRHAGAATGARLVPAGVPPAPATRTAPSSAGLPTCCLRLLVWAAAVEAAAGARTESRLEWRGQEKHVLRREGRVPKTPARGLRCLRHPRCRCRRGSRCLRKVQRPRRGCWGCWPARWPLIASWQEASRAAAAARPARGSGQCSRAHRGRRPAPPPSCSARSPAASGGRPGQRLVRWRSGSLEPGRGACGSGHSLQRKMAHKRVAGTHMCGVLCNQLLPRVLLRNGRQVQAAKQGAEGDAALGYRPTRAKHSVTAGGATLPGEAHTCTATAGWPLGRCRRRTAGPLGSPRRRKALSAGP